MTNARSTGTSLPEASVSLRPELDPSERNSSVGTPVDHLPEWSFSISRFTPTSQLTCFGRGSNGL